ncbi:MAG: TlpA disulfide reductase family protein [Sulfurimonas sp.]
MYKKIFTALVLGFVLLSSGCQKEKKDEAKTEVSIKDSFELTSIEGKKLNIKQVGGGFVLADQEDKMVLFDIYATWCPPCRKSAAMLSSLQDSYKDELVVIGLSIEDGISDEHIGDFAKAFRAEYFLANSQDDKKLIATIVKSLSLAANHPIPLAVLYRGSSLINYYTGMTQEEFIRSDIKLNLEDQ